MNIAEQIILVILSSFLAIFLLLGIILFVLVIKLIKSVKRITDKAERLTDKAEAVGDFFQHAAGPMALGRALTIIADTFFKKATGKKSKRKE